MIYEGMPSSSCYEEYRPVIKCCVSGRRREKPFYSCGVLYSRMCGTLTPTRTYTPSSPISSPPPEPSQSSSRRFSVPTALCSQRRGGDHRNRVPGGHGGGGGLATSPEAERS